MKQFYIAVEMVLRDALLPESHWFPYQIHSVRKYKVMISSNLAWLSRYFLSHLLYYIHLQKPCALRSLRRHFCATLHTFSAAQVTSYFCSFIPIPTHPFSDGNPKGCNKCTTCFGKSSAWISGQSLNLWNWQLSKTSTICKSDTEITEQNEYQ